MSKSVGYILLSCLCFSIMGAIVKLLGERLSGIELAFWRNAFGVLVVGISLLLNPPKSPHGRPFMLFMRGFFGASALIAYFYNITQIPLSTAFTLTQTVPFFIAIFSSLWLGARVGIMTWVVIALGFIGVLLLYPPNTEGFTLTIALLGVYSGAGAAAAYLAISELKNYYDYREIILSLTLSGTILPLAILYFSGDVFGGFTMPESSEWAWILLLGVVATLGQVYLTKGYANGDATILGVVSYTTIILTIFWGVCLGDPLPSALGIAGILLIIAGGLLSTKMSR
ncbi:MAG: DMT family transporter [Wolinella sp.]